MKGRSGVADLENPFHPAYTGRFQGCLVTPHFDLTLQGTVRALLLVILADRSQQRAPRPVLVRAACSMAGTSRTAIGPLRPQCPYPRALVCSNIALNATAFLRSASLPPACARRISADKRRRPCSPPGLPGARSTNSTHPAPAPVRCFYAPPLHRWK